MKHSDRAADFLFAWKVYGSGIQPEPEYPFDKFLGRKHRADFCFVDYKIIVEVDGGAWLSHGGRHGTDKDREKTNIAASLGYLVFRFSPTMLSNDPSACVAQVLEAMKIRIKETKR